MKRDKSGNKLFKRIHVKVIVGEKVYNHDYRAPAGYFYNHENIEDAREKMVDYIDEKFPHVEFRMVDIGPNAFNFIAGGARKP